VKKKRVAGESRFGLWSVATFATRCRTRVPERQ